MSPVTAPEGTVMYSSPKFMVKSIIYYCNIIKIYVWGKLWGKGNYKVVKNHDL